MLIKRHNDQICLLAMVIVYMRITFIFGSDLGNVQEVVTVGAIGDVLLHRQLQVQASQATLKYRDLWQHVAPLMRAVDVMYANLEGPVASNLTYPRTYQGSSVEKCL